MDRLYTAEASAYGQRTGAVITSDDRLDLQLSRPKSMGGDDGPGTNPEQLFAAGYAACFASAVLSSARREGDIADAEGATVTTHVSIGAQGKGVFGLAVKLEVGVPALEQAAAEDLVARAYERCPDSNATRGNVEHEFE